MSDSVISQVKSYFKKEGIDSLSDVAHKKSKYSPDTIAQKYISILSDSISSKLNYENVAAKINGFSYSYTENSDGYIIEINFANDLTRDSLYPKGNPEGVYNLAGLYDKGVNHTMGRVYGDWHGEHYGNRYEIEPSGFMDSAKETFMTNYASKYNVESVEIRDDFYGK